MFNVRNRDSKETLDSESVGIGIVVIAHKQEHAVGLVLAALSSQMLVWDRCVVVIASPDDRETYDAAIQASMNSNAVVSVQYQTHGIQGFNAGANRDFGTCYLLGAFPALSGIVYLDGDCVPSPTTLSGFRNLFAQAGSVPVLGNGTRSHSTTGAVDQRINSAAHGQSVFCVGMDRVAVTDRDLRSARVCWSCLCGLNIPAIQLVRALNRNLFGDSNRVFASTWDGRYGAEDTFLGLQVFRAQGIVVALDPLVVSVTHQDHVAHRNTGAGASESNKYTLPEADALLIKHLQCQRPCYVTLSTRAYTLTTRLRNQQMRDDSVFYNNILSVGPPPRSRYQNTPDMETVSLSCLGLLDPDIPLLRQLALFQVGRVVTYTYGSGSTLASRLPQGSATVSENARVVWNHLRTAPIQYTAFLEVLRDILPARNPNQHINHRSG